MTARVLIVDDEPLARDSLVAKVLAFDNTLDLRTAGDPHSALSTLREWRPAIVLLDIEMPGMTGFDLLGHLDEGDRDFALIFCTAHNEHAIRAFAESALDYILKPVEPERLAAALDKALKGHKPWSSRLPNQPLSRLAVKTRKGYAVVALDTVLDLASEAHETVIYTSTTEFVSELSLTTLEARLDPALFFRCHRSHIINLQHVRAIDDGESVVVVGTRRVPLARRRKADLVERLAKASSQG